MNHILKKTLTYLLSLAILVICVYFVAKEIDFSELMDILSKANYIWVLYSLPVILISHIVRAYRWKTLLIPFAKVKSILNLFSAVMVGYAANNILPRGGELLRPIVYARRERISKSSTIATIVLERFLDVLTLLSLFAIAFFMKREMLSAAFPWLTNDRLILFVVLMIFVLFGMLVFTVYPKITHFLLKVTIKPISEKLYNSITHIVNNFITGFGIIKQPKQYFKIAFDSYLMWFFYILPMYLTFYSFDFQARLNLGFSDGALILILVGIAFSVAPSPGAIGIYHYVVMVTMTTFYSISNEEALAYATLNHGVNYIFQIVVGGIFLLIENIKKIPEETANQVLQDKTLIEA